MTSNVLKLVVILALASVTPAWADDDKAAAPPEATGKDGKAAATGVTYESQYAAIVRECGVEVANQEPLLAVLKSWDADTNSMVSATRKTDPSLAEKLEYLDKEMRLAKDTNNADLVRDLSEKRIALVEVMGGWTPESRKQFDEVDAKYRRAIHDVVPADKVERLDEILDTAQDAQPNRPRRAPVRSPRALKAIVDRLGDLTSDQRKSIDGAFLQYREAQRANAKQSADNATQEKKLYDDVFAVLTDGQKTRVEQELAGRTGAAPATPKAPSTPGTTAVPSTPEEAKKPATPAAPPTKGAAEKP